MFSACVQATHSVCLCNDFSEFLHSFRMTPLMLGLKRNCKRDVLCSQLRAQEWMEGDDFNTEAVMNICGECDFIILCL